MANSRIVRAAGKIPSIVGDLARRRAFAAMERVLPVKPNVWCFCAWPGTYPHTVDNPRAVFEEVKHDPSIVKVILTRAPSEVGTSTIEGENVIIVAAESLRGAYWLATSAVVLLGFASSAMCSYGSLLTAKHRIIQLWHGIPLKRIGRLFAGETFWEAETPKYAATVCSSERDREMMAAAFAPIPRENVWLTGLPRNDLILKPEAELPVDYRRQLAALRARLGGKRLVLYAPTWRVHGPGRYVFASDETARLRGVLDRHNAVLGIRGHAISRGDASSVGSAEEGVIYLNDFPDVNVVLRAADVLVTDYSSIYIDFLITGRPVLHFTYDIDNYVNERGFLYDLSEALASEWFRSFDELVPRVDEALDGRGIDEARYRKAKSLFHSHGDWPARETAQQIKAMAARG